MQHGRSPHGHYAAPVQGVSGQWCCVVVSPAHHFSLPEIHPPLPVMMHTGQDFAHAIFHKYYKCAQAQGVQTQTNAEQQHLEGNEKKKPKKNKFTLTPNKLSLIEFNARMKSPLPSNHRRKFLKLCCFNEKMSDPPALEVNGSFAFAVHGSLLRT